MHIAGLRLHAAGVTPATTWSFLALTLADGRTGWGECTLGVPHPVMAAAADALAAEVMGRDIRDHALLPGVLPHHPLGMLRHTLVSALDQCVWDLLGQQAGVPIARMLGGARRQRIPLYANVNRGAERTPEGFARAARAALAQGFSAVKLAPFDPFVWLDAADRDVRAAYGSGLERIAAVRDAIGPEADLLVDCHWRFSPGGAAALVRDVAAFNLFWLECPIAEAILPGIRRLRGLANDRGMRLAGAETLAGLAAYRPLIEQGAYDVLMPDVKHAGGHAEIMRVAAHAATAGIEIAPHNPTGPICHAHSLHLCAALPNFLILEVQFNETPLFHSLVSGADLGFADGHAQVPTAPGLGVTLDAALAATLPPHGGRVAWADPRLG